MASDFKSLFRKSKKKGSSSSEELVESLMSDYIGCIKKGKDREAKIFGIRLMDVVRKRSVLS